MNDSKFKVGDRVKMSPMWKHKNAVGNVINVTRNYVVVRWDNVNGDWHYTHEQSAKLQPTEGLKSESQV